MGGFALNAMVRSNFVVDGIQIHRPCLTQSREEYFTLTQCRMQVGTFGMSCRPWSPRWPQDWL